MGRVKAMLMDQEEKLNEYVWYIVSECETYDEFRRKVLEYMNKNNFFHTHSELFLLSDVWSEYNKENK